MKVAIIGATGYGGAELVRFLERHPHVSIHSIHATSLHGEPLDQSYPHMNRLINHRLAPVDLEKIAKAVDLVFMATPSGVAMKLAPTLLDHSVKIIDLSGDFRIKDSEIYKQWYAIDAAPPALTKEAVYGLSEWIKEDIDDKKLIANPGCYPTAILLGLIPLVKENIIVEQSIIIDAKTGVSGAGKGFSIANHYSDTNENFKIYRVNEHQHTPEIEQTLNIYNEAINAVTFTPHLAPMTRGIMATMYATAKYNTSTEQLIKLFQDSYTNNYFIRVRPKNDFPTTKNVLGSNFCDIGVTYDERTNRITIVSAIDNLIKGASGQAIQNMNRLLGLPEKTGLDFMPVYP